MLQKSNVFKTTSKGKIRVPKFSKLPEVYIEPCQTSFFAKSVNSFKPITFFCKKPNQRYLTGS